MNWGLNRMHIIGKVYVALHVLNTLKYYFHLCFSSPFCWYRSWIEQYGRHISTLPTFTYRTSTPLNKSLKHWPSSEVGEAHASIPQSNQSTIDVNIGWDEHKKRVTRVLRSLNFEWENTKQDYYVKSVKLYYL